MMWWSWLYLVTRRNRMGYLVGVGVQLLWITYAVSTRQWGFIVSAIVYGTVNAIGWHAWRPKAEPTE